MRHYKDERTKELEHCPYCESECTIEVVQDPNFLSCIDHTIIGCEYCLCIIVEDSNTDAREELGEDWYTLFAKLFNDAIKTERETQHYKTFLQDKEEYKARTGHEMPIWYGICRDYIQMEKGDHTHEDVLSGLKNGLSKFEREVWLEDRHIKATHPVPIRKE